MVSLKKMRELARDCLNELYLASEPSITWGEVEEKYGRTKVRFYEKHLISRKNYDRIVKDCLKGKGRLFEREMQWVLFNYAPKFKEGSK